MDPKALDKLLKAQQEYFEKLLVNLLKPSEMNETELYSKLVGMIAPLEFGQVECPDEMECHYHCWGLLEWENPIFCSMEQPNIVLGSTTPSAPTTTANSRFTVTQHIYIVHFTQGLILFLIFVLICFVYFTRRTVPARPIPKNRPKPNFSLPKPLLISAV
uniref:Uncharacterized protein n=1 Tax=Meloidogyne enterolobii TaxID=390850 RepID=A0A6V7Y2N8_MELEN|nr:unnamed protein product [Meloidogyne enterolobii]